MQKKGFTLIELVIWIVIIWVGLIAVINILQYAVRLTNSTKSQVVAINLAREWVETVFNIRDSNRKMFASKKNECRLSTEPDYDDPDCASFPWMTANTHYYIKSPINDITYFTGESILLSTHWVPLNVLENNWDDGATSSRYRMCLYQGPWTWSTYRDSCESGTAGQINTKYGKYRRWIEIKGLYSKVGAWWTIIPWCANWNVWWSCTDDDAKELRFCSRVDYEFGITRRIEFCSAITNFQ